jgi:transcriptional regulator with XRE-family HTH domain
MLKESPNQMDDGWQRIPARSQLYCLEPIGKGTDLVESATSYLSRVANAHTVSTWMLLKHEIAPRLFGPDAVIRNRLSELTATMGAACNGENATASKLVSILQTLTGRDDLGRTTMGFCRGFVASRFLVRVEQAWCSACLNEWKKEGREVYLPLLWHVLAVRVCPRHGTKLNTKCHTCRRSFHPLAHSRPGFCHRCGEWLGTGSEEVGHPESVAHKSIAQAISDLLRDGPEMLDKLEKSVFPKNIEFILNHFFKGNIQALARYLGINRSSVIAWKKGSQLPSLLLLADVSDRFKISAASLLSRALAAEEITFQPELPIAPKRKEFLSPPKIDLEQMRRVLEEAIANDSLPRPSLNQLAKRLGCRLTTLGRRFPELAQVVKDRHQKFCAIRKEVRAKLFRSLVRTTVINIHKSGDYPSQWRVREALPQFVDMREPAAYDAWKQTLAELQLSV